MDELDLSDAEALANAAEGLRDRLTHRDAPRGPTAKSGPRSTRWVANGSRSVRARRWRTCPASRLPGSTTYLGVEAVGVVAVVRARMASLFTDRAIAYRARNGISHDEAALAVLVQQQVDAEAAGVLFTADPQSATGG